MIPVLLAGAMLAQAQAAARMVGQPLRMSVYCTAGDVQRHLVTEELREEALHALEPLHISRLFLEGRRGDEFAPTNLLDQVRQFFGRHGIATVPGSTFGVRQDAALGWLNWESAKTQSDVAGFFAQNAPVFREVIVDDFYCTADTSAASTQARGERTWGEYRRDLLVSLIRPMMAEAARAARRNVRLILKFPQWYDRFHLFGYDPQRMIPQFSQIWVGTEVRDPMTRRMGFVQPTEGYMNFRWLASQAPRKVRGAWFDHIECSAQNFVDQAFQSVLAGATELTLFHLGDVMARHPGDALLAERFSELFDLANRVAREERRGIAFYKPSGSDSDENLYLADYLGMLGLPMLPEADYPSSSLVAFLPVQAAADADIVRKMRRHLDRGATLVLTPAFIRVAGAASASIAGVEVSSVAVPTTSRQIRIGLERPSLSQEKQPDQSEDAEGSRSTLTTPIDIDAGLKAVSCDVRLSAMSEDRSLPWLTMKAAGRGQVLVLNVRTFSERDFRDAGEWLLAPRPLGLSELPQDLADELRFSLMRTLNRSFRAPARVSLHLFERASCVYNFRGEPVSVQLDGRPFEVPANGWVWRPS